MAIATTLEQYLSNNGIHYDTVEHAYAETAGESAAAAHVPGDCVAKAVLLQSSDGYMVAVLPASHELDLDRMREITHRPLGMAGEPDLHRIFKDCVPGAVPAVGQAYGLETMWDDSLADRDDIFFEAGDHCSFVHLSREDFSRLMRSAPHAAISRHL